MPLILDPRARALLEPHYPPGGLNEARLRMAHVPEGADLVLNPVSAAPGFRMGNVFVLAGVPAVMRAMFDGLKGNLRGGPPVLSATVGAYLGEGVIAAGLGALQGRYPDLEIGSYPFFRQGRYGASFVLRGTDRALIDAAAEELRALDPPARRRADRGRGAGLGNVLIDGRPDSTIRHSRESGNRRATGEVRRMWPGAALPRHGLQALRAGAALARPRPMF